MKRILLNLIVFFMLLAAVLGLGLTVRDVVYERSFLASWPQKQKAAVSELRRKVLFIGGSGVLFSCSAHSATKALGIPSINLGLHAGVGIPYLMDLADPLLRKNDIAVIIPEYDHFGTANYFGVGSTELAFMVIELRPIPLPDDFHLRLKIARFAPVYLAKRLVNRVLSLLFPGTLLPPPAYRKEAIVGLGDLDTSLASGHRSVPVELQLGEVDNDAVQDFARHVRDLQKRSIQVIVAPPPLEQRNYRRVAQQADAIWSALKNAGLPVFGETSEAVFADSLFLDTHYHLNLKGRTRYEPWLFRLLNLNIVRGKFPERK